MTEDVRHSPNALQSHLKIFDHIDRNRYKADPARAAIDKKILADRYASADINKDRKVSVVTLRSENSAFDDNYDFVVSCNSNDPSSVKAMMKEFAFNNKRTKKGVSHLHSTRARLAPMPFFRPRNGVFGSMSSERNSPERMRQHYKRSLDCYTPLIVTNELNRSQSAQSQESLKIVELQVPVRKKNATKNGRF